MNWQFTKIEPIYMEDAQFYTWSTRCKLKQDEKVIRDIF